MNVRVGALLFAGMAIFGSGTPISKIVGDGFPTFLGSGLRVAIAAAVLVPLMLVARRAAGKPPLPALAGRDWAYLAGIALFGMFAFSVLMVFGMRLASGVVGSVVMATTPAVTALASIVVLGDRATRWTLSAVALAVAGVAIVNVAGGAGGGGGSEVVLGSALVFGAVCGEAAYTLLGKQLMADVDPIDIAALAAAAAVPLFAPFAVAQAIGFDWSAVEPRHWAALGWWAAGTLALGTLLWYGGVRHVAGSVASVFMGAMPISALLLSYWLLGESFEPIHLVGAGAVLGAIGLVAWGARREEQEARRGA